MNTLTFRRALLKGAAMLIVVPHTALAGAHVFDLEDNLLPSLDLSTADGRIRAAAEWLGLPPAPLAYDEEDPRGGFLLTDELFAWFNETDLSPHLRWVFDGDATGASASKQRESLLQGREMLTLRQDLDETEQKIMVDTMARLAKKSAPVDVVLADGMAKMDAHRTAIRACRA